MKSNEEITVAVSRALDSCAGPISDWLRYDTKKLLNFCLGFVWAALGFDDDYLNDNVPILAEVVRQATERAFKE